MSKLIFENLDKSPFEEFQIFYRFFEKRDMKVLYDNETYIIKNKNSLYKHYLKLYNCYAVIIDKIHSYHINNKIHKLRMKRIDDKLTTNYARYIPKHYDNKPYMICSKCYEFTLFRLNKHYNCCMKCGMKFKRSLNDNKHYQTLATTLFLVKYALKRKYRKFLIRKLDNRSRERFEKLAKLERKTCIKANIERSKMYENFCKVYRYKLENTKLFNDNLMNNLIVKLFNTHKLEDFNRTLKQIKDLDNFVSKPNKPKTLEDFLNVY